MKMKQWLALSLALCLTLSLAACGKESPVYVQSVQVLAGLGGIAPGDRFTGLVVSDNVSEIEKDADKTVKELLVKEGQDVKAGETLFSYDTEELQLTLDKQLLELEQLQATIENCQEQIRQLEKERKSANASAKLQYTIQIQTTQVDQKEAELKIKTKEKEIEKSENLLSNATVVAPVDGRVQSINVNGTDDRGNPLPYISIQQVGSYRVKGVLGELQRGGLQPGDRLKIVSRTDPNAVWGGSVTLVDYESPIKNDNNNGYVIMGSGSDEMTAASKYPFYVELDTTEGLLLGQHVYMELDTGEGGTGLELSAAFIVQEEDGSAYVWAEKNGKLEKRAVTLGTFDEMMGTYAIVEGLTAEDYIAFPDEQVCRPGAPTTHDYVVEENPEGGEVLPEGGEMLPEGGEMMPEGGEMLPEGGEMMPEGGEMLPEDGEMMPEGGEMLPEGGEVLPEGGEVLPEEGGEAAPEDVPAADGGGALTPKDGSTMAPVETKEAVG